MNIQLLSDKILVKIEDSEVKSHSGVIISKANEPNDIKTGTVVAVGNGKVIDNDEPLPMEIKVNDVIWYQYGTKVVIEGESYMLLSESGDVIGVRTTSK